MALNIIITICVLLLLAYLLESTSSKTKIPSIIILIFLGFLLNHFTVFLKIKMPNLEILLPVFGTLGLILIVLESALELEINRSKFTIILKSFFIALLSIILTGTIIALIFMLKFNVSFKTALINALPLSVISSSVAIPSSKNLDSKNKEFVTYESSLSDILGIVIFNFLAVNEDITFKSFSFFIFDLILILAVSFISIFFLTFVMNSIKTDVKYTPIILLVILIYTSAKFYHLPALIFILLFGLFLKNFHKIRPFAIVKTLNFDIMNEEIQKFKDIVTEATFIIKALFFLTFGYLMKVNEILNFDILLWIFAILLAIFAIRLLLLKSFSLQIKPLVFIAPRGLITVLLFVSVPENLRLPVLNNSLVIQTVIFTCLILMIGLLNVKENDKILNFSIDKLYRRRDKEM